MMSKFKHRKIGAVSALLSLKNYPFASWLQLHQDLENRCPAFALKCLLMQRFSNTLYQTLRAWKTVFTSPLVVELWNAKKFSFVLCPEFLAQRIYSNTDGRMFKSIITHVILFCFKCISTFILHHLRPNTQKRGPPSLFKQKSKKLLRYC